MVKSKLAGFIFNVPGICYSPFPCQVQSVLRSPSPVGHPALRFSDWPGLPLLHTTEATAPSPCVQGSLSLSQGGCQSCAGVWLRHGQPPLPPPSRVSRMQPGLRNHQGRKEVKCYAPLPRQVGEMKRERDWREYSIIQIIKIQPTFL